ncbi:MAG: F0F1 ATP synthase subunit gamma [Magnetococcales bacterium]|nr:F0F1 ATP synthase subunit gamma [Magnetococcales bacterium]
MANLKTLRKRIRSVSNTKQITKAMKMVAAAKLRRAQERAFASRPYSKGMDRLVRSLSAAMASNDNAPPLLVGRGVPNPRVEILVCTADRGLCGSFNSAIIRSVRQKAAELQAKGFKVTLNCVGRKGFDVLRRQFGDQIRSHHGGMAQGFSFAKVEEKVAVELLSAYEDNKFDVCLMVFNTFQSAMSQHLTWRQIIPAMEEKVEEEEELSSYMTEPEETELMESLLPRNIAVQIYQALAESEASEHGARMTAMENAVRNATDMIRKLTITFNRTRQAAITKELMEIIGGAESLKG